MPCASSVCAPLVALHTSRRYRTSCQTFWNKGLSVVAIPVRIRSLKLIRIIGTGGTWTSSCTTAHKKNSRAVKSADRGGQEVDHPRPIHRSGKCLLKNVVASLWMWGAAPSCWRTAFGWSSSIWVINHNVRVEITSYAHTKKLFELLFTKVRLIFVAVTFLLIHLCNCSHHL
jgi:hypothetical protein